MAIMLVMTTMILAKNSQFNSTVLLRDLAYNIALSIREAQVYGISGKSAGGALGVQYGVYFASGALTQYRLFADTNSDNQYTSSSEDVQLYTVGTNYRISDFCATTTGGVEKCVSTGELTSLTLLFKRPDPDAIIRTNIATDTYTSATITAASVSGEATRRVHITNTGQLSIPSGS